jgi:hypothetical protein
MSQILAVWLINICHKLNSLTLFKARNTSWQHWTQCSEYPERSSSKWLTSTIPPWSLACFWNMNIWGSMAAASKYIEYVQQMSDNHSRFRVLQGGVQLRLEDSRVFYKKSLRLIKKRRGRYWHLCWYWCGLFSHSAEHLFDVRTLTGGKGRQGLHMAPHSTLLQAR